MRYISGS